MRPLAALLLLVVSAFVIAGAPTTRPVQPMRALRRGGHLRAEP